MSEESLTRQNLQADLADALHLARGEPALQADDYWTSIHSLRRRGDRETFDAAVILCGSPDHIERAVGADILAQLGYEQGFPFAAESEPILMRLLND